MTVKTISGTYSAGYVLHAPTTTLSITASGYVGGAGISAQGVGVYTIVNMGTVRGYNTQDFGAAGVALNGGSVTNGSSSHTSATISGQSFGVYIVGNGTITNFGTIMEAGEYDSNYCGICLVSGGTVTNGSATDGSATITSTNTGIIVNGSPGKVINFGTISSAFRSVYLIAGGSVTNGSNSDLTATMSSGLVFENGGTFRNFGEVGGYTLGQVGGYVFMRAAAGNVLTNGSTSDATALLRGSIEMGAGVLTNYASIYSSREFSSYLVVGTAGALTVKNFGQILSNDDGNPGDAGAIDLMDGGVVVNGSSTDHTALIAGNVGIKILGAGTVTNFGTIQDAFEDASVIFTSSADRFVAEAGSKTVGTVLGGSGTFELASGSGTITNLGVSALISGSVSTAAENFGTYLLDAGTSWTFTGTNTLDATQNLEVAGSATLLSNLDVLGTLTVTGSIAGSGTLTVAGGETMIDPGAVIRVAHWTTTGGTVNVGETLAYAGVFSENAGATIDVGAGDRLTLTGAASLHGTIEGAGVLAVRKATVGGLLIGGTAALTDAGTVTQSGTVTLGDTASETVTIMILKDSVWQIGSGSIVDGVEGRGKIDDFGLLIKDGAGVSAIAVTTYDNAMIEVAAGTLDFTVDLYGTGALKIDAGATLEADRSAVDTLTVDFAGADATLAMRFASNFAATISGFAASDTLDLLKTKATSASVNAKDQLVILNGKTVVATLQLTGSYVGDTFSVGSDGKGGTDITIAAGENAQAQAPPQIPQAPSPHLLVAAMAAMSPSAGGMVTIHDPLTNHAPMLSRPAP